MSRRALHLAVRNRIRTASPDGLGYATAECDVTPDGRPHPRAGAVFAAVHAAARRGGFQDGGCLDESYGFCLTLSVRIAGPWDRIGSDLLEKETTGFDARLEALRGLVFRNYREIAEAANTILGADPQEEGLPRGFWADKLTFSDDGGRTVDGAWWHASDPERYAGITCTMRFDGYRRIQALEYPDPR